MQRSEHIGQLAGALAKAQGKIKGAIKDANNPFFKSKYADLASVRDACVGPLSENGISVIQSPRSIGELVEVETILVHESGEWVSDVLVMPITKVKVRTGPEPDDFEYQVDAQTVGKAITYARRYALAAFAGVAPEDDDGNSVSAKGIIAAPAKAPAKAAAVPNHFEMACAELAKVNITKEKFIEMLKAKGYSSYVHKRDAEYVDDLIMQARAIIQPEPVEAQV